MKPTEPVHPSKIQRGDEVQSPEAIELSSGERFSLDLDSVNAAIVDMLTDSSFDPEHVKEVWIIRANLAENFVNSLVPTPENPDPRPRVQFDILVDKALIFERVGNTVRYLEELDDAEAFAHAAHLNDFLPSLTEELDEKVRELGNSAEEIVLKLRGHISFVHRYYLREMLIEGSSYEDFLRSAYGMILSAGGDPDEVFRLLGVSP